MANVYAPPETPLDKVIKVIVYIILSPYVVYLCLRFCAVYCYHRCVHGASLRSTLEAQAEHLEDANCRSLQRERKRAEPQPLPPLRRALSMPSIKSAQVTQSSKLLRLPVEIRRQILVEVLGKSVLHLVQLRKRIGHTHCREGRGRSEDGYGYEPFYDTGRNCWKKTPAPRYHYGEPINRWQRSHGCLGPLRSCRQLYLEGMEVLYTTNTFDSNHPQTLVFLARTIRPYRLATIRRLQIHWTGSFTPYEDPSKHPDTKEMWTAMWQVIGTQMKGLRDLKMLVEVTGLDIWHGDPQSEMQTRMTVLMDLLFESPRQIVRNLDTFDLEVPGDLCDAAALTKGLREIVCKQPINSTVEEAAIGSSL